MTGLSRMLDLVFNLTCRTKPLESGIVCRTRPISQELRGAVSSTMRTRSPGAKLLLTLFHFCLSCKSGKYSFAQRLQNKSAMYCTCLQRLLQYMSSFLNTPGGIQGLHFSWSRWFGVSASRSPGSSDSGVSGRSLSIASTSQSAV